MEETVLFLFPPLVLAPRLFPASRSTPPRISGEVAPPNSSSMSHPSSSNSASSPRSRRGASLRLDQRVLDRFGPVIGPSGLAVYVALARQVSSQGHCTVSFFELSRKLGSSRRQVLQALAKLEALRLIEVERRPGYKNRYHLRPFSTVLSTSPQPHPSRDGEESPNGTPPVPRRDGRAASPDPGGVPLRNGSRPTTAPPGENGASGKKENTAASSPPIPPSGEAKNKNNNNPPPGKGGAGENPAPEELLAQLTAVGVQEPKARWLVAHRPATVIQAQLRFLPHRRNMRDPAAALVRSIQEDWEEPEGHRLQQKRSREQERNRQEAQQRLRNGEKAQAQREAWERRKATLPLAQRQELQRQAEATVRRKLTQIWPADKPLPQAFVEAEMRALLPPESSDPPPPPPTA